MRLKIDKKGDWISVFVQKEPSNVPMKIDLNRQQLEAVIAMLQAAKNADVFKFELEL